MKRLIFTLSIVIAAGMISTAYAQVSVHANLNLGRGRGYYAQPVVVPAPYAPAYYNAPVPVYNDYGYGREREVVVNEYGGGRYYGHDRFYRDHRGYDRFRRDERRRW